MAWRALGMTSVLVLAGCGSPWLGDETVNIAPTSVADAQLLPTVPDETVVVAAAAPSTTATTVMADTGSTGTLANKGNSAVEASFVADAQLIPTSGNGAVDVAPVAPNGTSTLVPMATIAPAAVPARPAGDSYVNPVEFALATSHPVGQAVYPRSGGSVNALACSGYRSPIAAQEAFLGAGGPQSDRLGLDADGDGYACDWDPTPYRDATRS